MSMAMNELIEQLKDLATRCDSISDNADVKALNEAIEKLNSECSGTDAVKIIRRLLEKEGLNQKELADIMGTTRQNVSQMLNRNKSSMRFDGFAKMVQALGYEITVRKK